MATTIKTIEGVEQLWSALADKKRSRPICVISTPNDSVEPVFYVEDIENEVASVCDIYVILGGELTRQMQLLLPSETHVYGGAARVYGVGFSEQHPDLVGRIRHPNPSVVLNKATERLSSDIWAEAHKAGLLAKPSASAKPVSARVVQIYGEESVAIKLSDGALTTIRQEATFPGVPMSWLFKIDQEVVGKFDYETRIFSLDRVGATIEDLVEHFGLGTITYGLVKETDRQSAKIAIHPDVVFDVRKDEITGNIYDVVSRYLDVGDVVEVRIYRDPQGRVRLRMDDIDDTEVLIPALILVKGGEPWLAEDRVLFADLDEDYLDPQSLVTDSGELLDESEFELGVAIDVPAPSPKPGLLPAKPKLSTQERIHENAIAHYRGIIKQGNRRIESLNSDVRELSQALDYFREQNRLKNEELTKLRPLAAQARKAKVTQERAGSTAYARRKRFETQDEWFREEVRRAWFKDFAPTERKKFVLNDDKLAFGPNFLKGVTIDKVDDNELRKLIRNVVFVVTGRNAVEHAFEVHPLKENDKPMVLNGDAVMRMHVENGNPQAMRLHYLKQRDGTHVLLKVVNHDDYTI